MSAPAGLLAAALLVWGWSTGLVVVAIVLAVAVEVARATRIGERLARREDVVARSSSVAAAGFLVYALVVESPPQSLYTWLKYLPFLLSPMPAISRYRGFDTTHAYAAITLAAMIMRPTATASATSTRVKPRRD